MTRRSAAHRLGDRVSRGKIADEWASAIHSEPRREQIRATSGDAIRQAADLFPAQCPTVDEIRHEGVCAANDSVAAMPDVGAGHIAASLSRADLGCHYANT